MAKYIPTLQSTLDTYVQWRIGQQRLNRPHDADIAKLLPLCGWLSPSQPAPQLALYNRVEGSAMNAIEALTQALASASVVKVKSVRGKYFLTDRAFAPYAVAASNRPMEKRWRAIWKKAYVNDEKKARWEETLLDTLGKRSLTLEALLAALPMDMRRPIPLPLVAKAGGFATYLQWMLWEFEEKGMVHEANGEYAKFEVRFPDLRPPLSIVPGEAVAKLFERFFAWGNVANPEDIAWWSGWPAKFVEGYLFGGDIPLSNLVLSGSKAHGLMVHSHYAESLRLAKPTRAGEIHLLHSRDPMIAHAPFLYKRVFSEKEQDVLFPTDTGFRNIVIDNGWPVAAWRWHEGKIEWMPAGRTDSTLRKRIDTEVEKLSAWLVKVGLDLSPA